MVFAIISGALEGLASLVVSNVDVSCSHGTGGSSVFWPEAGPVGAEAGAPETGEETNKDIRSVLGLRAVVLRIDDFVCSAG